MLLHYKKVRAEFPASQCLQNVRHKERLTISVQDEQNQGIATY